MDRDTLYNILLSNFGFSPTKDQARVLYHLSAFILTEKERPLYLLRGYAGTGKTTLISTLVKTLPQIGTGFQLLAPTGRAAKVMSRYTGKTALTLHKKLYRFQATANGELRMTRDENKSINTIFIVDECSMISDQGDGFSWSRSLLDDLIEYVFSGSRCKLLLIGDAAQLPPVGLDISPAMDFDLLRSSFNLTTATYEMKEVMRQAFDSGILYNATKIRNLMSPSHQVTEPPSLYQSQYHLPLLDINNFSDIEKIDPMSFEELLWQSFGDKRSNNDAVVVCRSNKRANMFNQAIRSRVLQEEGELSAGEKLMIVKNNYYWINESLSHQVTKSPRQEVETRQLHHKNEHSVIDTSKTTNSQILRFSDSQILIPFLANGDMVEVMRINKIEEMYGFHFADVDIMLLDYADTPTLSVKILLETLHSEAPALTEEESKRLYQSVEEDYMDIPRATDRRKAMKENPYYNALQVKYGYALTCHKTQGGQWNNVFVEAPYLPEGSALEVGDLRWLYTALTRASEKVYLVNFKDEWFDLMENEELRMKNELRT
ncbi:MAG: ATP-dependent endonuclease [Lentimicrobiaceae bacterium]|nr:ATP-dependent endonuclease [Lentimicrobiaceae bacterium]